MPYRGPVVGEADMYRWPPYGFDCSSFVAYTLRQFGVSVPAFTDAIYDALGPAPYPRRGDCVLYEYVDEDQPGVRFPHTGFRINANTTIECRWPGGVQILTPLDTKKVYRRPKGW